MPRRLKARRTSPADSSGVLERSPCDACERCAEVSAAPDAAGPSTAPTGPSAPAAPEAALPLLCSVVLEDPALWSVLLLELSPLDLARLGLACTAAFSLVHSPATADWWANGERTGDGEEAGARLAALRGACAACAPEGGARWTIERLQICSIVGPHFPLIVPFGFASDHCDAAARRALDAAAALLRPHPGLRVRVHGHARPDAPAQYGRPLSQARAARVRQQLLLRLNSPPDDQRLWPHEHHELHAGWEEAGFNGANEGVRPGGYSEGYAFDAVQTFYQRRVLGSKLQAVGAWADSPLYRDSLPTGFEDGQCAAVELADYADAHLSVW